MRWGLFFIFFVAGVGCEDPVQPTGTVGFRYHLLTFADSFFDATSLLNCGPVAKLRLLAGNDTNGNQLLDDNEVVVSVEDDCNFSDANGDGTIEPAELGTFSVTVPAPLETNIGALEFLDAAGNPILGRTPDSAFIDETRMEFNLITGVDVQADESVEILFTTFDPPLVLEGELQAMFTP